MKKNKYVIIPILLMLSALIIIVGFQNCGEMKTLSSEGTFGSGTDIPSDPIDPDNPPVTPPSNLRTQEFTLSSLQTVDSSKILLVVDFNRPNSDSQILMAAKISELLQKLKGKHVQLGITSTHASNTFSSTIYSVRTDGGTTIDLTQPLPNLTPIDYVFVYAIGSNAERTTKNEATLAPLLGREVFTTSKSIVNPELLVSITPSTTDSQFVALTNQIQTYLNQNNKGDNFGDGLCVMSRFFGDDRPQSFLKPTDAVSALLVSDVNDNSSISEDCLKQADSVRKIVRSRNFIGKSKYTQHEYYKLDAATGIYSTSLSTQNHNVVGNWIDGAPCSPSDLAIIEGIDKGRTVKCTYKTSIFNLMNSNFVNYSEEDFCVNAFSIGDKSYLNALDYYRRYYGDLNLLDSCTPGPFRHELISQIGIAKEAKYFFITDLNALQTGNATLGFSDIVKRRFGGNTPISSIVHIPNESCTLPANHNYGTKYLDLVTYLGAQAFSTSICGNGYTDAFTRSTNISGGSQQKISFALNRHDNEVVYAILLVASDGQTVTLPSSSYTFEGSTVTILSPLLKVGMKVIVQYQPF